MNALVETLSLLAFTLPFVVASGMAERFRSRAIGWTIGALALVAIFVVELLAWRATGFPGWMRWPAEAFG